MAAVIKEIVKLYTEYAIGKADSRTGTWFLLGSPIYPTAVVAFYLSFVLHFGPSIMKNKKPFNLDKVLKIYNIVQILLNLYVIRKALYLGWFSTYRFFCEPVDWSTSEHGLLVAYMVWFFLMLKLLDMLDTVFIVLKKNDRQVTFLHVYHHTGMFCICWMASRYNPGGHCTFLGVVNGIVHVIMYGYYFFTSTWPHYKNTWWKKHITQLQMAQFMIIAVHNGVTIFMDREHCPFHRLHAFIMTYQAGIMSLFFLDFYYKTYIKKKGK